MASNGWWLTNGDVAAGSSMFVAQQLGNCAYQVWSLWLARIHWRIQKVQLGPSPSSPFQAFLPSSLSPPPLPSPSLRSRPHTAARGSGECLSSPSGFGQSPTAKRFLVHFKHYFNQERIENQISNSQIGVLKFNRTYSVLPNKVNSPIWNKNLGPVPLAQCRTATAWSGLQEYFGLC